MSKGYRVHFIGLPIFAERIKELLTKFDRNNTYKSYNTYYSKKDLVKFLLDLNKADLIYSMHGSVTSSGVFERVIKKGIPLVMHWMGTDVLNAIKAKESGKLRLDYAEYAHHRTEAEWLKKELKEVNINAGLQDYAEVPFPKDILPWGDRFEVLTYFGEGRERFYGWHRVREIAEALPNVLFNVVGTELKGEQIPSNVIVHGWVKDLSELQQRCVVSLRLTEHDGKANTVLEALGAGRYVLFTYPLEGCRLSEGWELNVEWLQELYSAFEKGELPPNEKGRQLIRSNHNPTTIADGLKKSIEAYIET